MHATLVAAEPAKNATVSDSPKRLRLLFSEPVVASLSEVRLDWPDGTTARVAHDADPRDVHALVAPVLGLGSGSYRVHWRIMSADGHAVQGSYVFHVARGAADTGLAADSARAASPRAATERADEASRAPAMGRSLRPEASQVPAIAAALRGAGVGCLMGAFGLLFFGRAAPRGTERRARRATHLLAAGAAVLLTAHLAAWLLHTAPPGESAARWAGAVVATPVGAVEAARVALALLAVWALALARRPALAMLLAGTALVASAAAGHSAAILPLWNVPAKALHLGAASLWLGGLLWLLTHEAEGAAYAAAAARVSSIALASVVIVAASGVGQALLILPSPRDVLRSAYGALVLTKVAGFAVLVLFGAHHRYRVLPRVTTPGARAGDTAPADLRRTVRLEVAVMVLVLLATGVLAYVPTPATD